MRRARRTCGLMILLLSTLLCVVPAVAEDEPLTFKPKPPMPEKFDWIQLTSGEWLKGEFIAMYDESLEFDSDELDLLTLDWEDVHEVLTVQTMQVGFLHRIIAVGKLHIEGDVVRVMGDEDKQFKRSDLITIAAGAPKEINYWSANVMLGLNIRRGNSNVVEATLDARIIRRTAMNRISIAYIFNYNETESEQISNNQRLTINWDLFVSDRLFVTPVFFEWFRDPFQNISHRETIGIGLGYELVDTPKIDWSVSGGPAYQQTTYESVDTGSNPQSTPAMVIGTIYDHELSSWMDFLFEYQLQLVNEEAGQYNHHMVVSFETEITSLIDFDVTGMWDRIQQPREDEFGITPVQDDVRLIVGLTFEF